MGEHKGKKKNEQDRGGSNTGSLNEKRKQRALYFALSSSDFSDILKAKRIHYWWATTKNMFKRMFLKQKKNDTWWKPEQQKESNTLEKG